MSDNLTSDRAQLIDNGIKILEELEKERQAAQTVQDPGQSGEPTPRKRTKGGKIEAPSGLQDRPSASSTGGSDIGASGESSDWEKIMHGPGYDGSSSELSQSEGPGGGDNPRDGSSYGRTDSREWSVGSDQSGQSVPDPRVEYLGESQPIDGSASDPLSVSDIEKILHLDEDVDHYLETGHSESGVTITETSLDGIESVLHAPPSTVHRRLRGVKEAVAEYTVHDHGGNAVKRGIEGNTASITSDQMLSSGHGVTQPVPKSHHPPKNLNVLADYVPTLVESVSETDITSYIAKYADSKFTSRDMLTLMLAKQDMIMTKLKDIDKLSREVNDVKKVLDNFGIVLSTLENYMESLMIIIPSSGKQSQRRDVEVNPDLRPVIGRDRARGYAEVIERKVTFDDITIEGAVGGKDSISDEFLNFDLDFSANNAANFVPTQDENTLKILLSIIEDHVKDAEQATELKKWVFEKVGTFPLDEIYSMVINTIEPGGESDPGGSLDAMDQN
nr:MAG: phosphoprotein [Wenzhou rodent jeilongvirus 2]WPV62604.1 MAG: phosphoprotein [Wenzhou rodent jeilongvirus 2]WPV62611.1 MAG: phosphoprotein [Wenzhou rodent jeilongvirus 2]